MIFKFPDAKTAGNERQFVGSGVYEQHGDAEVKNWKI